MVLKLDPGSLTTAVIASLLLLGLPIAAPNLASTQDDDTHQPANKTGVAGSTVEFIGKNEQLTILSTSMRTSTTQDLAIQVTLECALWTTVATVGNEMSEATARVKVWVEMDGEPVKVSSDDAGEDQGKVVFCDRTHRQTVSDGEDEEQRIEQFLRTRSANAFNWVVIDAGNGIHDFEVKAEFETDVVNVGDAEAGVGKRTLVIEPVHLVNDATI